MVRRFALVAVLFAALGSSPLEAWGSQAHRLIAAIAADELSPAATENVRWLLDGEHLTDVAMWADDYRSDHSETAPWHFVNIPSSTTAYSRERDCPRPSGSRRASDDGWRDCVVDRILYNRDRLTNTSLSRGNRAMALRFLVHLVGDVHQPFHAIDVERGGTSIRVSLLGSPTCSADANGAPPCTLHAVWDSALIARRKMSDRRYLTSLEPTIGQLRRTVSLRAAPDAWANESLALAKAALVRSGTDITDAYVRRQTAVIDRQLVLGGLRLASMLNDSLKGSPGR